MSKISFSAFATDARADHRGVAYPNYSVEYMQDGKKKYVTVHASTIAEAIAAAKKERPGGSNYRTSEAASTGKDAGMTLTSPTMMDVWQQGYEHALAGKPKDLKLATKFNMQDNYERGYKAGLKELAEAKSQRRKPRQWSD